MRREALRIGSLERITETSFRPTYEVNRERWIWPQRAAFWILEKLGARREVTETTSRVVSWYPEQSDSLIQHLIDQHEAWLDIIWREKGKVKIYVGPNENAQLLQMMWDTDFPGVVELVDAQTRIGYGGEAKVFNIPVTVVPWMDGALLVPA